LCLCQSARKEYTTAIDVSSTFFRFSKFFSLSFKYIK